MLNDTQYLRNIALNLEALAGTSGAEENSNVAGYLKRIEDATAALDGRVSQSLFRSAIPFVYPSSGSVGNNGALSGITALTPLITPGPVYIWMPAGAIVVGSAAGWYYCVMSSTTAGTLYNNTYTTGAVAAPASPTAFATTGPGAYTQEVAAGKQGPTFTLPAGALGPNGKLSFEAFIVCSSNATNKAFAGRAGTTALLPSSSFNNVTKGSMVGTVKAQNSTSLQVTDLTNRSGSTTLQASPSHRAIDFSASQDLNAFLTLTAATEWMVLLDFEIIQEVA